MTLGLISDTHGVFSPQFREFLEPVDELWHAGDWGGDDAFLQEFKDFKPIVGVYGNCDGYPARYDYPEFQSFEREGLKVLMTHIGGYPGHYNPVARRVIMEERPGLFVCGHSQIGDVPSHDAADRACGRNGGTCMNAYGANSTGSRM